MDSIKKVINYLWRDEARHFMEEGALADDHVFIDLVKARIHLEEQRLLDMANNKYSAQNVADSMYLESPFDLGSEEDNKYRDIVDKIIFGGSKYTPSSRATSTTTATPMKCPLCKDDVKYEQIGNTHMWVCTVCPFIGFEWVNSTNTVDLVKRLSPEIKLLP